MTILTVDDFADKKGQAFVLATPEGAKLDVVLTEVAPKPAREYPGKAREPFSLTFKGTRGTLCPQAIYPLSHASGWQGKVFLVPVGDTSEGDYLYHAVFN